jgi:hypothetical protein
MNVGDLVRYYKDYAPSLNPDDELGIVTKTGTHDNGHPQCHVIWFTCNNEGWWDTKNLEVLSENR